MSETTESKSEYRPPTRMTILRSDLMKDPEERAAWQELAEELQDEAIRNANNVRDLLNGTTRRRNNELFRELQDSGALDPILPSSTLP